MKNKALILLSVIIWAITACTEGGENIGFVLTPNESKPTRQIDTLTVNSSTIKLDSFITSNSGFLAVGTYNNENFGTIQAESYFDISHTSENIYQYATVNNIEFDSLSLVLDYSGDWQGDTTEVSTLSISKLVPSIRPSRSYYNTSYLAADSSSIGTASFKPKPNLDSAVIITLEKAFGDQLFTILSKSSTSNAIELNKLVSGFKLTGSNDALLNFDVSSSYIRMYFHKLDNLEEVTADFKLLASNTQFNTFSYNSIYDSINELTSTKSEVTSLLTDNKMNLQLGYGLAAKISIPYIKNIKEINSYNVLHRVTLKVYTNRKSAFSLPNVPASLSISKVNGNNEFENYVYSSAGQPVTGTYQYDPNSLVFKSWYSFDLTNYFNSVINDADTNRDLMIYYAVGSELGYQSDYLTLYDQHSEKYPMEIEVTYTGNE